VFGHVGPPRCCSARSHGRERSSASYSLRSYTCRWTKKGELEIYVYLPTKRRQNVMSPRGATSSTFRCSSPPQAAPSPTYKARATSFALGRRSNLFVLAWPWIRDFPRSPCHFIKSHGWPAWEDSMDDAQVSRHNIKVWLLFVLGRAGTQQLASPFLQPLQME
jgi:hypothetical protein